MSLIGPVRDPNPMKYSPVIAIILAAILLPALVVSMTVHAATGEDFEVTPAIQKQLDQWKKDVQKWANDPAIVKAVLAQNEAGPMAGMDNAKWKKVRRRDDMVKAMQSNAAAQAMIKWQTASKGAVTEAFLNAAQGEKVALIEKTSSYIHKGKSKFDEPWSTKKAWQGEPQFDESVQIYQLQLAAPVLVKADPMDEKPTKPIGVMVVGISLDHLSKPKAK